ncbi:MAG: MauE/DoxX family redox-associated membrane protein [Chloroflexota bacterium]
MMADVAAILQVAIGAVLVAASAAKVLHRTSLGPFLLAAGFSVRYVVLISRVTPVAEGTVGLLLISYAFALPVAIGALLFSLAFTAVLAHAYRGGVEEPCHCFGPFDADRLSSLVVVRAGLLAAAALVLVYLRASGAVPVNSSMWYIAPDPGLLGLLLGCAFVAVFALSEQMSSFERGRKVLMPPRVLGSVRE